MDLENKLLEKFDHLKAVSVSDDPSVAAGDDFLREVKDRQKVAFGTGQALVSWFITLRLVVFLLKGFMLLV